jgi:glycosyltransferase involved in cell wall biosynthesis
MEASSAGDASSATPSVSVIIPTHNRAELLNVALASLQSQTYTDFEAIVVDDGSTDDTPDVVGSFDDRFHYIYQVRQGRSRARNRALEIARGRYVAFLDDDDVYRAHKLELQVRCLEENPEVGWAYSSAQNVDGNGRPFGAPDYKAGESGWIHPLIALYLPLTVLLPTVMVRHDVLEVVGGFDERMERFEDTDMWRRISKRFAVRAIADVLVDVRAHAGNRMEDPRRVFQSVSYYVDKVLDEDQDADQALLRKRASELFNHYGAAVLAETGSRSLSRPFFRASLRYRTHFYAIDFLVATYVGVWILRPQRYLRRILKSLLSKTAAA